MDCYGVQQHAGDAIDRSLPKDVEYEFQAHLARCGPCRREIALEKLSKRMVQENVPWISTPRSIQAFVLESLRQNYKSNRINHASWMAVLGSFGVAFPVFVGGLVALAFFLLVSARQDSSYRQTAHVAANDIIHQSFQNFALLKAGQMQPEMVSTTPESVDGFFHRSTLPFGVNILKLPNCEWYGGSTAECSGVKQAHLVYKVGSEWIYVSETSDDDALFGRQVSLPPAAKRGLIQSGWYTDLDHPNCNVVLWKTNEAVCVAVSTMKKGRLVALLTTQ